jgi:ABC-type nitrate/sulfonate/bicarbonate transport system substrate-binding protein
MSKSLTRLEFGVGLGGTTLASSLATPRPALAEDNAISIIAGTPTPALFDTLELVAAGAGFYKAENLDVTKNYGASPAVAAQLVATGKADLAALSVEPVLAGYEKGLRLQLFLSRQRWYSYVLGVPADSPIRTLADFKGTVIGELNTGNPGEVMANSILSGAGLKKSDYAFLPIGVGAQGLTAIASKRVAGAALPYLEFVTDTVVGHAEFRIFRHPILKDIGNVGYAATPATIASKASALQRFSRAIVKAAFFVRVNPTAAGRLYLEGSGQKVTPESLGYVTKMYALLQDNFPAADLSNTRVCLLSPKSMELYSTYMVQYGIVQKPVPGPAVATDQFIAFANDFDHKAFVAYARSAS